MGFFVGRQLKKICNFFIIVFFDDKRMNNVFYNSDITTTKSNSMNYVTRPIVLECSSPYMPALAAVCSELNMMLSTYILLNLRIIVFC